MSLVFSGSFAIPPHIVTYLIDGEDGALTDMEIDWAQAFEQAWVNPQFEVVDENTFNVSIFGHYANTHVVEVYTHPSNIQKLKAYSIEQGPQHFWGAVLNVLPNLRQYLETNDFIILSGIVEQVDHPAFMRFLSTVNPEASAALVRWLGA